MVSNCSALFCAAVVPLPRHIEIAINMKFARHPRERLFMPLMLAAFLLAVVLQVDSQAFGSDLRRSAIVRAIQAASPSVVNIHGRKTVSETAERGHLPQSRQVNGMGTGVVLDERGYIITNYHVVEGVTQIQVTFDDGKEEVGRLVAYDLGSDLAVIKVPTTARIPVVKLGTSSDLMTGETVIAVGNAFGYEHTVTTGIISALHRTVQVSDDQQYDDLIQTDASINPGNSGGPLMNIDGDVIGINVAVRVGAQGIGFAIPIDRALEIASQLMNIERIDGISHGVRGRTEIEDGQNRLVVQSLISGGPGELSGLEVGDVIRQVDGHLIDRTLDLERAMLSAESGKEFDLVVEREGDEIDLLLTVAKAVRPQTTAENTPWSVLGLRLATVDPQRFRQYQTNYRGGLQVLAVRDDSPAQQQGIRRGDILVGMHNWATIALSDVDYILKQSELGEASPVKFYVIRGRETFFGYLPIAMNQR